MKGRVCTPISSVGVKRKIQKLAFSCFECVSTGHQPFLLPVQFKFWRPLFVLFTATHSVIKFDDFPFPSSDNIYKNVQMLLLTFVKDLQVLLCQCFSVGVHVWPILWHCHNVFFSSQLWRKYFKKFAYVKIFAKQNFSFFVGLFYFNFFGLILCCHDWTIVLICLFWWHNTAD